MTFLLKNTAVLFVSLNLLLYVARLGVAGWLTDLLFDGDLNPVSAIAAKVLDSTLISASVGVAFAITAFVYMTTFHRSFQGAAIAAALIAFLLELLTFGFSCKFFDLDDDVDESDAFDALAAMSIVQAFLMAITSIILMCMPEHVSYEPNRQPSSGGRAVAVVQQPPRGGLVTDVSGHRQHVTETEVNFVYKCGKCGNDVRPTDRFCGVCRNEVIIPNTGTQPRVVYVQQPQTTTTEGAVGCTIL